MNFYRVNYNLSNYLHTYLKNIKKEILGKNGKGSIIKLTYPLHEVQVNYNMNGIFYDHFKFHGNGLVEWVKLK